MTQAFNLSQFANNVNTSGQADLATAVTGTLPVANGGTGKSSVTAGSVVVGNGTSAMTEVAAGTSGNVLTSNGSTWISQAASGGQYKIEVFATAGPATWTKPASTSFAQVTVIGGGGGSPNTQPGGGPFPGTGGRGGLAITYAPVTGPVAITVGAGGNTPGPGPQGNGGSGGSSSFGSIASATGGAGGTGPGGTGASGTGTVSVGVALCSGNSVSVSSGSINGWMMGSSSKSDNVRPGTAWASNSTVLAGAAGAGPGTAGTGSGGKGGVVIVEYVG